MIVSANLKAKIKSILEQSKTVEWMRTPEGNEYEEEVFDESFALEEIVKLIENEVA